MNEEESATLRQRLPQRDSSDTTSTSTSNNSETEEPHMPFEVPPLFQVGVTEAPAWPTGVTERDLHDYGKSVAQRLLAIGPMIALFIIFFVGLATVYVHTMWWPLNSAGAFAHLFLFLAWNYATLNNFILSVHVGGGYVPRKWKPADEIELEKVDTLLQWCKLCEGYKPPRSHHCSKCGRCVMKMDHHCLWINNCVGHRNHAFFVRFLISAILGCMHATGIIGLSIYHAFNMGWYITYGKGAEPIVQLTVTSLLVLVAAIALSLGVTVALLVLLSFQINYIRNNRTGIEEYICEKASARMKDQSNVPFVYPYDIGWRRNIAEVLSNFKGKPRNNGIWWPIRSDCTQFVLSQEQLRQKKLKRSYARLVKVTKSCKGGICGALCISPMACLCQPMADQSRLKIEEGDVYIVTGGNKRWLYGYKQGTTTKGWFPRTCAELLPERPNLD